MYLPRLATFTLPFVGGLFFVVFVAGCDVGPSADSDGNKQVQNGVPSLSDEDAQRFTQLVESPWRDVFLDTCIGNWRDRWFLDGQQARVTNVKEGMDFHAGEVDGDHAGHAVLWTKQSFEGDIKIEYEYTRLDHAVACVNILYILATGSEEGVFDKDIAAWAGRRSAPLMKMYFNHMNLLHISYAAYDGDNQDPDADYIRARRYMPQLKQGLKGTGLKPDYFRTGLFAPGVPHQMTVIKTADDLFMQIVSPEKTMLCRWDITAFPGVVEGRIGLRHMFTRAARYRNFRVSVPR